jgi:hypothetical protein
MAGLHRYCLPTIQTRSCIQCHPFSRRTEDVLILWLKNMADLAATSPFTWPQVASGMGIKKDKNHVWRGSPVLGKLDPRHARCRIASHLSRAATMVVACLGRSAVWQPSRHPVEIWFTRSKIDSGSRWSPSSCRSPIRQLAVIHFRGCWRLGRCLERAKPPAGHKPGLGRASLGTGGMFCQFGGSTPSLVDRRSYWAGFHARWYLP